MQRRTCCFIFSLSVGGRRPRTGKPFRLAAQEGLLPDDLAARLQQAAGMRNVLVHFYEMIDYDILHASIAPALRDFALFVALAEKWDTSE